jgi:hypothetical protein
MMELYQSETISAFFCCGCAANTFVHAIEPQDEDTKKCILKRIYVCIFFVAAVPQLLLNMQLCRIETHVCGPAAK